MAVFNPNFLFLVLQLFAPFLFIHHVESYVRPSPKLKRSLLLFSSSTSSSSPPVNGDLPLVDLDESEQRQLHQKRSKLKLELLQLGASYDRGFGATSRAIDEARATIDALESINPESNAARGVDGNTEDQVASSSSPSPIRGKWRMVWTTASDVLVLGASPLVTVGAIYQVFDPLPVVTNIIDLLPRIQNLFPVPNLGGLGRNRPDSVLRIEVTTRASSRRNKPMRVGLVFERVKLSAKILLGNTDVANFLPPLEFDLPRVTAPELERTISSISSAVSSTKQSTSDGDNLDIGFFDVAYLDDDLLIIRQNAPGGLFVLSKVDNIDP